jgi:hypothetical protein
VPSVQVKVAEWVGWTPVAEIVIDAGEFEALLTNETLPVTVPVAAGAKVTSKVAVPLRAIMSPAGIPLAVSPGPESVTLEMMTSELPELVNVTLRVELLPIFTSPKLRDEALAVKGPGAGSTVNVAALLVTDPAELLTTTLNLVPLAEVVSVGVV